MRMKRAGRRLAMGWVIAGLMIVGAATGCGAPTPTGSAPAAPAAATGADPAWEQVVVAAKREGRIVVTGPAGADIQEALTRPFQELYPDIQVEYTGPPPPQIPPKLLTERAAGLYTTDLIIVGTTTIVGALLPAEALDPIRPFLVGPETRDESVWRGGKFDFADEAEQYNLVAAGRVQVPMVYNPTLVSPTEFKTFQDFLNPKWKGGKFVMLDPRVAGAGLDIVTFMYTQPTLGRAYLDQFFAQEPVVSRDDRQLLDWIARGQYPFGIGPSATLAYEMKAKGLPLELFPGEGLQEGSFIAGSNGTMAVANRAPHPNAVKVYLNWVLSRDGQYEWSKASGLASRRTDVPKDHLPPFIVPREGVAYQENYKEKYVTMKDEIADMIANLVKS